MRLVIIDKLLLQSLYLFVLEPNTKGQEINNSFPFSFLNVQSFGFAPFWEPLMYIHGKPKGKEISTRIPSEGKRKTKGMTMIKSQRAWNWGTGVDVGCKAACRRTQYREQLIRVTPSLQKLTVVEFLLNWAFTDDFRQQATSNHIWCERRNQKLNKNCAW